MKLRSLLLSACLLLPSALAPRVHAVMQRVVVVQVENVDAYLKELRRGQELLTQMGSVQKLRVWRARFAGPETGTLTVTVDYPDLAAFVDDEKKVAAHAEFQAWLKDLARLRKILSDSLRDELVFP